MLSFTVALIFTSSPTFFLPLAAVVEKVVTIGATVSIVILSTGDFGEVLPALDCCEVTDQTPSVSLPSAQLVTVGEATNVQNTVLESFTAATFTK